MKEKTLIDHVGISVSDVNKSKAFYQLALAPIGFQLLVEVPASLSGRSDFAGFGQAPKPSFWIGASDSSTTPIHIAFSANSRTQVDSFYQAALAAGGRDNGPPGLRPHYHSNYYGAFVLDFDGHNIEVVCHTPA